MREDDTLWAEADADGPGLDRVQVLALAGVLLLALVAGVLVLGVHRTSAPAVGDAASSCAVDAPRFGVTDDPADVEAQHRFERTGDPVPATGRYTGAQAGTSAVLHAATHQAVVVFVRPGAGEDVQQQLGVLLGAAERTRAPVVVADRSQGPALVALSRGYRLTCSRGDARDAREVRRFAAQAYASLADPADDAAGPAPTAPRIVDAFGW